MFSFRHATDFYGVRQLLCVLLALPITWAAARILTGGPPADWNSWPDAAKLAVRSTSSGLYGLAFVGWLWLLLQPFLGCERRRVLLPAAAVILGLVGAPGAWKLLRGVIALLFQSSEQFGPALWILGRIAGLPLVGGGLIILWPMMREHVQANALFRRLFVRGAAAGFAGPIALRKYAGAPPKRRNGTLLTEGFVVGQATAEDAYAGGRVVTIDNSAHVAIYGAPGAGKFLLSGCSLASTLGSKVCISIKPELADSFLAFAADPNLLPLAGPQPRAGQYGVDPRPSTRVTKHLPNSVAHLIDPTGESVWPSGSHSLVSDIDPNDDDARTWALTITGTSFIRPEHSHTDPWFTNCPKGFAAAVWLYFRVTDPNPTHWYLPYVFERAMGSDPATGHAGAQSFVDLLHNMRQCQHPVHGAFIRTKGIEITELGDRAYGSLKTEIITNCAWVFDPIYRRQLERPSTFSYRAVGDDLRPTSVFIVTPRDTVGLQNALPWLRAHAALALATLGKRKDRPRVPTAIYLDECRQYLSGVSEFSLGLTLLREARVRLITYWQSWPSCQQTLGERIAEELDATSASIYFGIDCIKTAEKISRRLGQTQLRNGQVIDVKPPAEILRELRISSPMCYLTGGGYPAMRLRRASFKPVSTKDGLVLPGFGVEGQFDELSRYGYGGRP